jgi:hypothetical protein
MEWEMPAVPRVRGDSIRTHARRTPIPDATIGTETVSFPPPPPVDEHRHTSLPATFFSAFPSRKRPPTAFSVKKDPGSPPDNVGAPCRAKTPGRRNAVEKTFFLSMKKKKVFKQYIFGHVKE